MNKLIPKLMAVLLALISLNAAAATTRYVDLNSPNPTPPYTSWPTAATNINEAIEAAIEGDLVLVTNGVYNTGGRTNGNSYLTNRVAVNKPLTLQSVNGPTTTSIEGYQVPGTIVGNSAVRCVYLTNGATLVGFTITNGANRGDGIQEFEQGAGIYCETTNALVSNCIIVSNIANAFGQGGAGVRGGTLTNCLLVFNKGNAGGGAFNSMLYGCTIISNTATSYGGGVGGIGSGSVLNNCILAWNSAPSGGGFGFSGAMDNCVVTSNTATSGTGGGASGGVISNCVFVGNRAFGNTTDTGMGGGAYFSSLNQCLITNNTARRTGGGVDGGNLTNCTVTANSAPFGGGVNRATLRNCVMSRNTADVSGGGTCSNILINCVVSENSAGVSGGGSYFSSMTNCLVTGNSASAVGGVVGGIFRNSIVYYNFATANPNYLNAAMDHCCASPLPSGGIGNISESPQLADAFHLSATSPCLGAGNATSTSGVDLDGQSWNVQPAIGCDEYYSGTATGPLSVVIVFGDNDSTTGFATGTEGKVFAKISGNAYSNYWEFGDGFSATNQPYTTHTWTTPGLFSVKVLVFNSDNPGGVVAERIIQIADQPVHYVYSGNPSPVAPYLSWETAATNIQDAVDAAFGGSSILVSNGVYRYGGKVVYGGLSNRVAITKSLVVRSVNGPLHTVIQGYQVPGTTNGNAAMRCVFLTNGASLAGFTLTNGATFAFGSSLGKSDQDFSGGGIWCVSTNESVSNCVVVANAASSWAAGVYRGNLNNCALSNNINYNSHGGGGAYLSLINDCVVSGNGGGGVHLVVINNSLIASNSAFYGASSSTLNNCTIIGNTAGGAGSCALNNCIVKSNSATTSSGGAYSSTLRDCILIGNTGSLGGALDSSTATNCFISGNQATQSGGGAYNSTLNNCVITGNTAQNGGGAYGSSMRLTNCIISGNWATNGGGGAASGAILVNCLVTGNSATNTGGGVSSCTLINGTVVGNKAVSQGGGAYQGTLRNSIIYFNSATVSSNVSLVTANNSCTFPAVAGAGNFTNAPRFLDQSADNFRLQTNSPCIGSGNIGYTSIGKDLDGRPRIVGGMVDVGAYEFQGAEFGELIAWLQDFGLPTDGSADFTDADGDGMNNYGEWRSDTNPTNSLSSLRMVNATASPTGADVTWQSVSTRNYWLERATNLGIALPFQTIATNIVGVAGLKTFTDTSATNAGPYFYRVGVQ